MVLGFTHREIKRLVLRENLIIAFVGIPIGLLVGPLLHRAVLERGLPNTLEFVPYIQPISWMLTVAFTVAFALLVNGMLGRKFREVNMVESLKSIE
jgi:putative ABC transport system permease protein